MEKESSISEKRLRAILSKYHVLKTTLVEDLIAAGDSVNFNALFKQLETAKDQKQAEAIARKALPRQSHD